MGSTVFWFASFMTSAIPRYTALKPQMMPSMPVIVLNVIVPVRTGLPVSYLIVSMKNSIVRLMKTNWSARLAFNVPKNMPKVKIPHIVK